MNERAPRPEPLPEDTGKEGGESMEAESEILDLDIGPGDIINGNVVQYVEYD